MAKTFIVNRLAVALHLASVLRRFEGVREKPLGSNRGPQVEKFQAATTLAKSQPTGWAWCAAYEAYCFQLTWRELGIELPLFWPATASCDEILYWARKKGIDHTKPLPFDVFLSMKSRGDAVHTGFVLDVQGDGEIETIEGNTNTGGSREGIGVFTFENGSAKAAGGRTYVRWLDLLPERLEITPLVGVAALLSRFQAVTPEAAAKPTAATRASARLILALPPFGTADYHHVKGARLVASSWHVEGSELLPALRGHVPMVQAVGKLRGLAPLRTHLERVGLVLDEARTVYGNHLGDSTDPRQYVFVKGAAAVPSRVLPVAVP